MASHEELQLVPQHEENIAGIIKAFADIHIGTSSHKFDWVLATPTSFLPLNPVTWNVDPIDIRRASPSLEPNDEESIRHAETCQHIMDAFLIENARDIDPGPSVTPPQASISPPRGGPSPHLPLDPALVRPIPHSRPKVKCVRRDRPVPLPAAIPDPSTPFRPIPRSRPKVKCIRRKGPSVTRDPPHSRSKVKCIRRKGPSVTHDPPRSRPKVRCQFRRQHCSNNLAIVLYKHPLDRPSKPLPAQESPADLSHDIPESCSDPALSPVHPPSPPIFSTDPAGLDDLLQEIAGLRILPDSSTNSSPPPSLSPSFSSPPCPPSPPPLSPSPVAPTTTFINRTRRTPFDRYKLGNLYRPPSPPNYRLAAYNSGLAPEDLASRVTWEIDALLADAAIDRQNLSKDFEELPAVAPVSTPLSREDGHRLFINNILAYPSAASPGSVIGIWSWVAGLSSCRFNFDFDWDPHSVEQLNAYD